MAPGPGETPHAGSPCGSARGLSIQSGESTGERLRVGVTTFARHLRHGQAGVGQIPRDTLQAQVTALQLTTAELHQQMQDSSALIQALAEQNTELIKRVEVNRLRVVWLFVLVVALAIGVLVKVF